MEYNLKDVYMFISDANRNFYRAIQQRDGSYAISFNKQPKPLDYNPVNLLSAPVEAGTNKKYFSMNLSFNYPLDFIKDGAAILRHFYHLGKGIDHDCYLTMVKWNGHHHELAYHGKFELREKIEDPKTGKFTVPIVDDSAWGILSQNDNVEYAIDCSNKHPKTIPVLVDGINLINRITYQPIPAVIGVGGNALDKKVHYIPISEINQEGDSVGSVTSSQTYYSVDTVNDFSNTTNYIYKNIKPITINVNGTITYNIVQNSGQYANLIIYFYTSKLNHYTVVPIQNHPPLGRYTYDFNMDINLDADERLIFTYIGGCKITFEVTNIFIQTKTREQPKIVWGWRPLDLAQELVTKATAGRYTIHSDFFTTNNKEITTSGDAIRGVPNAQLYTSFEDFFATFNALNFMALKSPDGRLFMERAVDVYRRGTTLIDLGELINVELEPAADLFANEIEVGSPPQDYRHPSGRLEFNSRNTFSLPASSVKRTLSLMSKYRLGCFDIQFLITDYNATSTVDNTGDKDAYILDITDDIETAIDDIETFELVTVNSAPLSPLIKSPFNNEFISNDHPVIRGISTPGDTINIYADGLLDGSTTADAQGKWSYVIQTALSSFVAGVSTGEHLIQATFTDLLAPTSNITIIIDVSIPTPVMILYPVTGDTLYNPKPLIKGIAQAGTNLDLFIDGVLVASMIADQSCKWEYKSSPLANGSHTITINGVSSTFTVDNNVSHPLITYIGSELDGFLIMDNLPLIEGVAQPGQVVTLWLNYITYKALGQTTADANGNWSYQVIPTTYIDPSTSLPVNIAPIINGLNTISTSLQNYTVGVNIRGYKLNRPAYSSIVGVTDNTVFNTRLSPKRMLLNHKPMLASIMAKRPQEKIKAETFDKNGNLVTTLNNVTISERADVTVAELGQPMAILEYAKIKTVAKTTFYKTLRDFNNGGVITGTFNGTRLYFLPIGNMRMGSIIATEQEWKLLLAPDNSYQSLLNLYKNGLQINLNSGSMFHSNYNSLHFVTYDFQQSPKFNHIALYDDWFENRNNAWSLNPKYVQKYQKTEVIKDQLITNGISGLQLNMYRCSDAELVATIPYAAINPAPIAPPTVVVEATIDFGLYPEDQYFFTISYMNISTGTQYHAAISERVQTKTKWENTILIESKHSMNMTGAFFSTGFKTVLRVEGHIKKLQPDASASVSRDDMGNSTLLHGMVGRKRVIRFGTAYGLPDYLYLKVADALTLDDLLIENTEYTMGDGDRIEPSDDVVGHPLYYYEVELFVKDNLRGKTFGNINTGGADESVILVVDGEAMGLPAGSLIDIKLD